MSSRTVALAVLLTILPAPGASAKVASHRPSRVEAAPQVSDRYGKLPMAFEPNVGQTDARVRYLARGRGCGVFITDEEAVLALAGRRAEPDAESGATGSDVLRMRVIGTTEPQVTAERELAGTVNYLLGDDETKWLRDVPTYAAVRWAGVSEGVDAVFYGTPSQLE